MQDNDRVQFDFTPEAYEELGELRKSMRAASKAEVIRYALRALQWLLEVRNEGGRVLVERGGQAREAVFHFLPPATVQKVSGKTTPPSDEVTVPKRKAS